MGFGQRQPYYNPPIVRNVYLAQDASDIVRMGATPNNTYGTFQAVYNEANALQVANSGEVVINVGNISAAVAGNLAISSWNSNISIQGMGSSVSVLGNITITPGPGTTPMTITANNVTLGNIGFYGIISVNGSDLAINNISSIDSSLLNNPQSILIDGILGNLSIANVTLHPGPTGTSITIQNGVNVSGNVTALAQTVDLEYSTTATITILNYSVVQGNVTSTFGTNSIGPNPSSVTIKQYCQVQGTINANGILGANAAPVTISDYCNIVGLVTANSDTGAAGTITISNYCFLPGGINSKATASTAVNPSNGGVVNVSAHSNVAGITTTTLFGVGGAVTVSDYCDVGAINTSASTCGTGGAVTVSINSVVNGINANGASDDSGAVAITNGGAVTFSNSINKAGIQSNGGGGVITAGNGGAVTITTSDISSTTTGFPSATFSISAEGGGQAGNSGVVIVSANSFLTSNINLLATSFLGGGTGNLHNITITDSIVGGILNLAHYSTTAVNITISDSRINGYTFVTTGAATANIGTVAWNRVKVTGAVSINNSATAGTIGTMSINDCVITGAFTLTYGNTVTQGNVYSWSRNRFGGSTNFTSTGTGTLPQCTFDECTFIGAVSMGNTAGVTTNAYGITFINCDLQAGGSLQCTSSGANIGGATFENCTLAGNVNLLGIGAAANAPSIVLYSCSLIGHVLSTLNGGGASTGTFGFVTINTSNVTNFVNIGTTSTTSNTGLKTLTIVNSNVGSVDMSGSQPLSILINSSTVASLNNTTTDVTGGNQIQIANTSIGGITTAGMNTTQLILSNIYSGTNGGGLSINFDTLTAAMNAFIALVDNERDFQPNPATLLFRGAGTGHTISINNCNIDAYTIETSGTNTTTINNSSIGVISGNSAGVSTINANNSDITSIANIDNGLFNNVVMVSTTANCITNVRTSTLVAPYPCNFIGCYFKSTGTSIDSVNVATNIGVFDDFFVNAPGGNIVRNALVSA